MWSLNTRPTLPGSPFMPKSQFSKAEEYVSLVRARTPTYGNLLGSMVIPCVTNQPGSLLRTGTSYSQPNLCWSMGSINEILLNDI